MNKIITLSTILSITLYATNGDNLINIGTKARGMGGAGIALYHGAESSLTNPSLITRLENNEFSVGGILFKPEMATELFPTAGVNIPPQSSFKSDNDISFIPEISYVYQINDNWYLGAGIWGTAGMGIDYSNAPFNPLVNGTFGNFNMVTSLQLLQTGISLAYKTGGLSIGILPILQYGNMNISYKTPTPQGTIADIGTDEATNFGFGYNFGLSYAFSNGFSIGGVYKSSIQMDYGKQLTTATTPFMLAFPYDNTLAQPSEYGMGISYTKGNHTFAYDYKKVNWAHAKGYSDFGWRNSNVYAFGYQYSQNNWALRAGYNYASFTVVEVEDTRLNFFNLLGFPATSERHYTLGGSYDFSNNFTFDLAYVYQPKSTKTFSTAKLDLPFSSITTEHVENSMSFQLNYNF